MHISTMYCSNWLKELSRGKEQVFCKTTKQSSSNVLKRDNEHHKSRSLIWSLSDLIFVTACFQIDIIYLCNMSYMFKNSQHPGFIQIMVMYLTWGPALIYMEIFLGQYVQHGCLYMKNMSPLTSSAIGYGMLITIYLYSVAAVDRLGDAYMFLFRSFSSELPWMVCPKDSTEATCIDRQLLMKCFSEDRKDDCYPKLGPELFSTRIYYREVHSTIMKSSVLLIFGWLTVYVIMKRNLSETRIILKRLLLLMMVLFFFLLMPLMGHVGQGLSVAPFFSVQRDALLNVQTWMRAFKYFLRDHGIVRGGYQLIGCHIKPGPTAANMTIYSCAITYMIIIFCQIFSTGILGVLIFYMKVTDIEEELYFPKYSKLFNFYPFALGLLQVRQLWCLVFFVMIAFSSISFTLVNMTIIEESMYDNFPIMLRYRSYFKVILCTVGFLLGFLTSLVSDEDLKSYEDEVVIQIGDRLTIVVVWVLTISVGYVYGVERFSDDMNFLNGSQPTTYWKIWWRSLPFGILILAGQTVINIQFPKNNTAQLISSIIYVVLLCLALLSLLQQIIVSMKARNVAGILFQATNLWGPPLPEDRIMRNTYNPREETKYWRKNNQCTHHCLIDKGFVLSVIFREINTRTSERRRSDRAQTDFTMIREQLKQSQVSTAIDKVSSTQLETFEKEVKRKVKLLEEIEAAAEREAAFKSENSQSAKTERLAVESADALDLRIEQMIKEAELKARIEKTDDIPTRVHKIPSNTTKQLRQMPTIVPRETPRRKKALKTASAGAKSRKDVLDKGTDKINQILAVNVPQFVLEPSEKIKGYNSSALNSALKKDSERYLERSSKAPPSKLRGILRNIEKPFRTGMEPKLVVNKIPSQLPVWPLPPETPRYAIPSKLSSESSLSSSSTSCSELSLQLQPNEYEIFRLIDPINIIQTSSTHRLTTVTNSPMTINKKHQVKIKMIQTKPEIHYVDPNIPKNIQRKSISKSVTAAKKLHAIDNSTRLDKEQVKENKSRGKVKIIEGNKAKEIVAVNIDEAVKIRIEELLGDAAVTVEQKENDHDQ